MRYLIAALALLSSIAFGMAVTPSVMDACPAGGPPALGAGVSPDGAVCVGQSVRDTQGTVWTVNPSSNANLGNLRSPLINATYSAGVNIRKAQMKGGQFQFVNANTVDWSYWDYAQNKFWNVGMAPLPQGSAPPGTR